MQLSHDDTCQNDALQREAMTLADAFMHRMADIDASAQEGFAVLALCMSHVLTYSARGNVDAATTAMAMTFQLATQCLEELCELYLERQAGRAETADE